jgi:hypothetical protein
MPDIVATHTEMMANAITGRASGSARTIQAGCISNAGSHARRASMNLRLERPLPEKSQNNETKLDSVFGANIYNILKVYLTNCYFSINLVILIDFHILS